MTSIGIQLRVGIKPVNKPTDKVILRVNNTEISQSAQDVVRKLLAPLFDNGQAVALAPGRDTPDTLALKPGDLPKIGDVVDGVTYAGLVVVAERLAKLWVLQPDDETKWQAGMDWAVKQGGTLPSRMDALTCWQNVPKLFQQKCYWTCAQHADNASYAWIQSFDYGDQDYGHKDTDFRVRAVRRELIQ